MRDKKALIKTILAWNSVDCGYGGVALNQFDRSGDVLPNENTTINLYGEMHGYKNFMTLNFKSGRNSMMKDVAICL